MRLWSVNQGSWLCAGYFNEILFYHKKIGGPPRSFTRMAAFRALLMLVISSIWVFRVTYIHGGIVKMVKNVFRRDWIERCVIYLGVQNF